ncbi:adenylylsulfate reductase subunit B [Pseudobutyrivibrio sp. YE44]|uniref:4Fe-4S dicluster domain-containing protein n=1 Tax=Pseudobutyrivibrio sp. YE44 TaxID=1520802 RepID=UPI000883CA3B|nr:ferredoxin family protein [Pseudobutyrivibrio sp. YE44]SDB14531.1 adenylylsulfate reductase subunit B [Pseudobutyrivibrio sp. YE44]
MSIKINQDRCVGCKRCIEVCPGNLIKLESGKAAIKRERDCWGCTSCLKECHKQAIEFFLGADVGGKGTVLTFKEEGPIKHWIFTGNDGATKTIEINSLESNKY